MALEKRAVLALLFLAVPGQAARTGEEEDSSKLQGPNYAAAANAARNARKYKAQAQAKAKQRHEENWAKYGEMIQQDMQTIPSLAQQPPEGVWPMSECLGSGKTVQKKDYHYKEESPKATPSNAFRFDKSQLWDLGFQACSPNPSAINDYCVDSGIDQYKYDELAENMEPFERGECCGGVAKLDIVKEECGEYHYPRCSYKKVAKMRCVGFSAGQPCRLSSWLMGGMASNSCAEGYQCEAGGDENRAIFFGGPDTGVCVAVPQ